MMELWYTLYLLMAGAVLVGATLAAVSNTEPKTRIAAHRGGALLWPENSLLAFDNALRLGVDYLECDVHLTRDGEVLVIHDATLNRTTTGQGPVNAFTLAEIRRVRVRSGRGAASIDQAPPTLSDLLALVSGRAQLLLEIKSSRHGSYPGIEERILALLASHQMVESTLVMSFDSSYLMRLRALHPTIKLGGLLSARQVAEGRSIRLVLDDVVAAKGQLIGLQHTLLDADVVALVHQHGFMVGAWTVNDEAAMQRVLGLGADILISDRPDVAKTWLNARAP